MHDTVCTNSCNSFFVLGKMKKSWERRASFLKYVSSMRVESKTCPTIVRIYAIAKACEFGVCFHALAANKIYYDACFDPIYHITFEWIFSKFKFNNISFL